MPVVPNRERERDERRALARYWPHSSRAGLQPIGNDQRLRMLREESERAELDLVGRLMGDPPPSRREKLRGAGNG